MGLFNRFKRRPKAEVALYCFVSAIFMVVCLSYLYIFFWAVLAGLRTHGEIVLDPFAMPEVLQWKNYTDVFSIFEVNHVGFWGMLKNSVWFSVCSVFINQFVAMTFSYVCTKYKFWGSELPYTIILIMLTLPIYGSSGAEYKLVHSLGLIDSYAYILTAAAGFNMFFLYYRAYFKNMSWTYAEAAMMDGANDFQIYFKVMLPQTKPIFGALYLSQWVTNWNSYEGALIYLPHLPTLPVGIFEFNTEMIYRARLDILFAACVWVALPAFILFIAFNKVITTNVSVGGIKG